jgi:hypothetical protein
MNRQELKARLDEASVSESDYIIEGVDRSVRGLTEGGILLACRDNHWVVSVEERGVSTVDGVFTTEDEACEYVYRELTVHLPIGPPLTPGDVARAEDLARKRVSEHRQWVEEHHKEPDGAE